MEASSDFNFQAEIKKIEKATKNLINFFNGSISFVFLYMLIVTVGGLEINKKTLVILFDLIY